MNTTNMLTSLYLVLSLVLMITDLTGSNIYSGCRPANNWAFDLKCDQTQLTWVQDALFGATTDGGAIRDFCEQALPNRTTECKPQRNQNNRDLRLACNAQEGPCRPTSPSTMMNSSTFSSCGSYGFTYAYAEYDCLSAINYRNVYLSSVPDTSRINSSQTVYLMSMNYDSQGYTSSQINQCSVTVTQGTSLRFKVLDLLGQTAGGGSSVCPYKLTINSGNGNSREWCAQMEWDYFVDYEFYIPAASTGSDGMTVDVAFSQSPDSSSVQGRVWILVDGNRTDGSTAFMETFCGSTTSTTTSISTTITPTTTTASTPTTTPTTPTSTPTISTSTSPSTPTTTTTTTTPTITPTTTTTPMTSAATIPTTTMTTTTTTAPSFPASATTTTTTTSTISTLPSSTSTSATAASSVTTRTTLASTAMTTATASSKTSTSAVELPSLGSPADYTATDTGSTATTSIAVLGEKVENNSNNIVAIAIGVSVGGVVLLCIIVSVSVCINVYCLKKKTRKRQSRDRVSVTSGHVNDQRSDPMYSISSSISNNGGIPSPGVTSTAGSRSTAEDEIYSEIDDAQIGVTIIHSGTSNSHDPSTVEHQFSVGYAVGSPTKSEGGRHKDEWQRPIRGKFAHLNDEGAEDQPLESPSPYIDQPEHEMGALYIPPGDTGESDTDVQHNLQYTPLYGLVQKNLKENQNDYI